MASIPLLQTSDSKQLTSSNFSRWVSLEVLLDLDEMDDLLNTLNPIHLLSSTPLDTFNPFYLKKEAFVKAYEYYITELKNGRVPHLQHYKPYFYLFLTRTLEGIYRIPILENKEILKITIPTLLIKPIALHYSKIDDSLRVGPLNPEAILWGLQISFPQLIQQPGSPDIKTINPKTDENALLFKQLRSWVRNQTHSMTFKVADQKLKLPVRLGQKCLNWIAQHPQLQHHTTLSIL